MQILLIYGDITKKSPREVQFPSSFSLSVNPKQCSSEEEAIEVLNEIIIPYVTEKRERLGLEKDQTTLLIMEVFKGQKKPCMN